MSVPVAMTALAEQIDAYGDMAYVVTASKDGKPHVVSVRVAWRNDELVVGAGRHTSHNAEATGTLSLLWPAPPAAPYSLIVDGDARRLPGEEAIAIRPTRAVLHRVAGADSALDSCVTVFGQSS